MKMSIYFKIIYPIKWRIKELWCACTKGHKPDTVVQPVSGYYFEMCEHCGKLMLIEDCGNNKVIFEDK